MQFRVTENDLTLALFYGIPLVVSGSGTKAEAREQAKAMLAAADGATPDALPVLKALVDVIEQRLGRRTKPYQDAMRQARAMIEGH